MLGCISCKGRGTEETEEKVQKENTRVKEQNRKRTELEPTTEREKGKEELSLDPSDKVSCVCMQLAQPHASSSVSLTSWGRVPRSPLASSVGVCWVQRECAVHRCMMFPDISSAMLSVCSDTHHSRHSEPEGSLWPVFPHWMKDSWGWKPGCLPANPRARHYLAHTEQAVNEREEQTMEDHIWRKLSCASSLSMEDTC